MFINNKLLTYDVRNFKYVTSVHNWAIQWMSHPWLHFNTAFKEYNFLPLFFIQTNAYWTPQPPPKTVDNKTLQRRLRRANLCNNSKFQFNILICGPYWMFFKNQGMWHDVETFFSSWSTCWFRNLLKKVFSVGLL